MDQHCLFGKEVSALLRAVADELSDLALETSIVGESLSASPVDFSQHSASLQKFDAIVQALSSHSIILRTLTEESRISSSDDLAPLIELIPFFDVRQRLREKVLPSTDAFSDPGFADDNWIEC